MTRGAIRLFSSFFCTLLFAAGAAAGGLRPPGKPFNEFSAYLVESREEKQVFRQEEVPLSDYDPRIQDAIQDLLTLAGDGLEGFVEAGFYVFILEDDEIVITPRITSNSPDTIHQSDMDRAFHSAMSSINVSRLRRMQFYHTHPAPRAAHNLSSTDMRAAGRLHRSIPRSIPGSPVPVDMHAIPYNGAMGQSSYQKPPALGSGTGSVEVIVRFRPSLVRATYPEPPRVPGYYLPQIHASQTQVAKANEQLRSILLSEGPINQHDAEEASIESARAQGRRLGYLSQELAILEKLERNGGPQPQGLSEVMESAYIASQHWLIRRDFLSHAGIGHPNAVRLAEVHSPGLTRVLTSLFGWALAGMPAAATGVMLLQGSASLPEILGAGALAVIGATAQRGIQKNLNSWVIQDRSPLETAAVTRAQNKAFIEGLDNSVVVDGDSFSEVFGIDPPLTHDTLDDFVRRITANAAERCADLLRNE